MTPALVTMKRECTTVCAGCCTPTRRAVELNSLRVTVCGGVVRKVVATHQHFGAHGTHFCVVLVYRLHCLLLGGLGAQSSDWQWQALGIIAKHESW